MTTAIALLLLAQSPTGTLESKIRAEFAKQKLPGMVVVVERKGKQELAMALGYANLEHKVPMKLDSVHELASVSKQFTATAILKLADEGKLSLDDSITKFVDGAPDTWKAITIRHLLHHTSGLPDYISDMSVIRTNKSAESMMMSLMDKPLRFAPGAKFEYSNSGYMALGHIAAKASGSSLWQLTETAILKPNKLAGIYTNDPTLIVPNRADGYDVVLNKLTRESYTSRSFSLTGDGHLMASAPGLLAWSKLLQERRILKPETWKSAWTPSPQSIASGGKYGFGFTTFEAEGKLRLMHGGGWMGTTTLLETGVDEKFTVVVLINQGGADVMAFGKLIHEGLLDKAN